LWKKSESKQQPIYMKSLKLQIIVFLTILSFNILNAQQNLKLNFKRIELTYYETNGNPLKINVINYVQINEYGIVTVHLYGNNGLKFYRYQLSNELMSQINSLMLGKDSLKKQLVKTKMDAGKYYAGSYNFIAFDNQKLCFVQPYMSKAFNLIFSQLEDIILKQSENAEIDNPKFKIKEIEKRVLIEHKKSNYLPKIGQPPSMK
jgi:hypothetical protein